MAAAAFAIKISDDDDDGNEYEYKISQEQEGEEIHMEKEKPQVAGDKLFRVVFIGKYLLKRRPELYSGPMETLTGSRQDLYTTQEGIQREDFSTLMSEILTKSLGLPQQQSPVLISKFIEAARSFSARPENSGVVEIPIKFSARVITVQKKGEDVQATIARAVRPSPDSESVYQDYHSQAHEKKWRLWEDKRYPSLMDGTYKTITYPWEIVHNRFMDIVMDMEIRGHMLTKEEKIRLYKQIEKEEEEAKAVEE